MSNVSIRQPNPFTHHFRGVRELIFLVLVMVATHVTSPVMIDTSRNTHPAIARKIVTGISII
jgi:hypothetical protein